MIAHGGTLVDRTLVGEAARDAEREAQSLRSIPLDARRLADLRLIANGAFSPLIGFMVEADYTRVVRDSRLADGSVWSIPITLPVARELTPRIGERVALTDAGGTTRAILDVHDVFTGDRGEEARNVYGTDDAAHPGVAIVLAQHEVLIGGPVHVLPETPAADALDLTPRQTRAAFAERGWKTIVGFQTRNPIHRAHEYIQKCALEIVDGLLVHPLVGETKSDDVPAEVRLRCYEALLERYYPKDRVLLATLPAAMRYAGPREAIFHALVRKNYGCTHFSSAATMRASARTTGRTPPKSWRGASAPRSSASRRSASRTASIAAAARAWRRTRPARIRPRTASISAVQRCARCSITGSLHRRSSRVRKSRRS